jgi:hypothetical protein
MVQTFGANSNNDIYIDDTGNLSIVYGLEATLQACEHAVKTRLGEMILAIDQGIPYFEAVFVGVPNIGQFQIAIRLAILNVSGVTDIISLDITQLDNVLSYTAVILTTYGRGVING